jgi:coenzyme F420-reducing hydrogenase alpha subunit
MPFPWALAFKVIPWSDVIAAAPTVARSAQKLWNQVGGKKDVPAAGPAGEAAALPPDQRLAELEAAIARLDEQSARQAEITSALAEQNARLVEAVAVLRLRSRLLGILTLLMLATLIAAALWPAA